MLTKAALLAIAAAVCSFAQAAPERVLAQTVPAPSPSPSASPTPIPVKKASRLHVGIDSYTSGVNQQFVGPGVNGAPEIPTFASGGPLAPAVPYDFFSGAPTTTGQAITQDIIFKPVYNVGDVVDVAVSFGYGSIGGSGNVGAYWGNSLMPTINPHLGSRADTVTPFFATHNNQDPVNASRLSILQGSLALHDGRGALVGGYFDTHQSLPFVFAQAPWTNTPTQLVPQVPQSLGDGTPQTDVFRGVAPYLPLHGYDLWGKFGNLTVEANNANLPAPAGTIARESSLSGIYRSGEVTLGAEVAHLMQSGGVSERFLFGSNASIAYDGTAAVPFSSLTGQRMTVVGFRAAAPAGPLDVDLQYGHSCYAGDGVVIGTTSCTAGNYYDATLHRGFAKFDLSAEFVRFEPTYAPAVLPYGTIENVWSAPYAFPATWLHQSYQFVDNHEIGANRQGFRLATTFLIAGVETRVAYGRYEQIAPFDLSTGLASGFIEPYFAPQVTATQGVKGVETHASAWFAWHPAFADVTLELSDVITNRAAPAGRPQDAIAVDYPSYVASLSRTFGRFLAGAGVGRYAVYGSYDATGTINANLRQNVIFSGLQFRANANSAYALEYQVFSVDGNPIVPGAASPAYHGPQFQFYQRLRT